MELLTLHVDNDLRRTWARRAVTKGWSAVELRRRLDVAGGGAPELHLLAAAISATERAAIDPARLDEHLDEIVDLARRLTSVCASVTSRRSNGNGEEK